LFIIGRPDMTIVAFGSNVLDIFEVNDIMSSKGWHLNALQRPNRLDWGISHFLIRILTN
jgi:sphinganine-1-phosphate aldolase